MDKEKMIKRALYYSKQLLNGIEPNSGLKISKRDIIHTNRMKNYFQFVSEILEEICQNDGVVMLPTNQKDGLFINRRLPFNVDEKTKSQIYVSNKPIKPVVFVNRINREIDKKRMEPFSTTTLNKWLIENGLLESHKEPSIIKRTVYDLNRKSRLLGLRDHQYIDQKTGEVKKIILLTKEAQEFILNNINEIGKSKLQRQKDSVR